MGRGFATTRRNKSRQQRDRRPRADRIVTETERVVKKPPTVFIVDNRSEILNSLAAVVKSHFLVECYSSAAQFIADQHLNQVGCILLDPLQGSEGDDVLRWLHDCQGVLSIVLISGLIKAPGLVSGEGSPASIALAPYEVSALLTMVTDGIAGSISRQIIRDSSRH